MTRRSNGEGNIYKRRDGRWEARWHDQDGRRRSAYTKTRSEATKRLREAQAHVAAGVPSIESGQSFELVAENWRKTALVRQGITPSSLRT